MHRGLLTETRAAYSTHRIPDFQHRPLDGRQNQHQVSTPSAVRSLNCRGCRPIRNGHMCEIELRCSCLRSHGTEFVLEGLNLPVSPTHASRQAGLDSPDYFVLGANTPTVHELVTGLRAVACGGWRGPVTAEQAPVSDSEQGAEPSCLVLGQLGPRQSQQVVWLFMFVKIEFRLAQGGGLAHHCY